MRNATSQRPLVVPLDQKRRLSGPGSCQGRRRKSSHDLEEGSLFDSEDDFEDSVLSSHDGDVRGEVWLNSLGSTQQVSDEEAFASSRDDVEERAFSSSNSSQQKRTGWCPRRNVVGLSVRRVPSRRSSLTAAKLRGVRGLLMATAVWCVLRRVAQALLSVWPNSAAKAALVLVRVAGYVEDVCILLGPLMLAVALSAWHRLELPGLEGKAGRQISTILAKLLGVNLGLVILFGLLGNYSMRVAACFYVPSALCACVYMYESILPPGVSRFAKTWMLFVPLIFEYKMLNWWCKYAMLNNEEKSRAYKKLHIKYAPKLFALLTDLGGVFVKIGQLLSMLPTGVLPEYFTAELKKLQNAVPPRPGHEARRLISEALGRPVEGIFSRFDDVPVGSASIGQVHRARLRSDGREVVVKVQYPEVSRTIEPDFNNCERVAWLLDRNRVEEVRETKKHYIKELDFITEARTLGRIRANLRRPFPKVTVPEPVPELCTKTVLVMTFIPGTPLLDGIMHMAEAIAKARGMTVEEMVADVANAAKKGQGQGEEDVGAEVARPCSDAGMDKAAAFQVTPRSSPPSSVTSPRQEGVEGGGIEGALGDMPGLDTPRRLLRSRRLFRAKTAVVDRMKSCVMGVVPDSTKVALLQRLVGASDTVRNLGAALYNNSAGRLGATRVQYRKAMPRFDPRELSYQLWRVHGHQVLVDGLFSTDPHPGNILLNGKGHVGLIDFGQVCELTGDQRMGFARLIIALASGNDDEIARRYMDLGVRTKSGNYTELLTLSAKLKFGSAQGSGVNSVNGIRSTFERYKALAATDPLVNSPTYDSFSRVERLINILRGTSFILGVSTAHSPLTVWLDMAREVLAENDWRTALTRRALALEALPEAWEEPAAEATPENSPRARGGDRHSSARSELSSPGYNSYPSPADLRQQAAAIADSHGDEEFWEVLGMADDGSAGSCCGAPWPERLSREARSASPAASAQASLLSEDGTEFLDALSEEEAGGLGFHETARR
eukprot:TRINITY_DN17221_c0_g1_i1.p1 TRINITY_DN17221_c0_g1~~TRINITY_DN17221_c0_g1_i1.p1  ORF type:complete len:1037 (+),score=192.41 TRINITY_DN17221_c0_g1_i1:99-3113(+)